MRMIQKKNFFWCIWDVCVFLLVNFKAFIETVKAYFVKIIFCIWPLWIGFCVGFYGLLKLKNIFKNFWRFEDSFMKGRVSWLSNILVATRNILYTCSPCGSVLLARIRLVNYVWNFWRSGIVKRRQDTRKSINL